MECNPHLVWYAKCHYYRDKDVLRKRSGDILGEMAHVISKHVGVPANSISHWDVMRQLTSTWASVMRRQYNDVRWATEMIVKGLCDIAGIEQKATARDLIAKRMLADLCVTEVKYLPQECQDNQPWADWNVEDKPEWAPENMFGEPLDVG